MTSTRGSRHSVFATLIAVLSLVAAVLAVQPAAAKPAPVAPEGSTATAATGAPTDPQPVQELWTATTRTYLEPDGGYTAQIYPTPVNYLDPTGDYLPIANRLVPSDDPNYDVENKAGSYSVELPADISDAPVQFEADGSSLGLTLIGGQGSGDVSGKSDTYEDVLPGVDVTYTALNDGVEETTTLANRSAPSSLTYAVDSSADLTPQLGPTGSVEFVDAFGTSQLSIPPPAVVDSFGASGPASFSLSEAGDQLTVSVRAAWLQSPDRAFPVTVDPSITITGATTNCYIEGGTTANTNFCTSATTNKLLKVGSNSVGTTPYRSLLKFDLSAIPATSTVVDAELGLHLSSALTSTPVSVELHQISTNPLLPWTTSVTWNSPTGVVNQLWATAGGDFASASSWTTTPVGPTAGWYYWYPTTLVDGWVHGSIANQGMILKLPTENVNQILSFDSTQTLTSANKPVLTVVYHLWQGEEPFAPAVSFPLTERMGLQVDVRDGNLELHANDVNIAGTGLPLIVDRFYNSKLGGAGDLGTSWFLAVATGIKLTTYGGSVDYRGPSGDHLAFILNPDGSYSSPAGVDATLVKNGDGTFDLTFHANAERYHFGSNGRFLSDTDKNGNHITFGFSGSHLATITDTQGRVTNVTYNAAGFISQLADVTGRTWQYTYDANNDLVSYRDPSAGVTTYVYNTSHNMTQVTDPVGNVTKITYANGNVVQVIRVTNLPAGTGPTTSFTYNTGYTSVTDSNNHTTKYYYDKAGRGTQAIDPASKSFEVSWNADNRPTHLADAFGADTPYTYDLNNNLTRQVLPTGATTTWTYTDAVHPFYPTSRTDAQGNTTTYTYNAAGNLTTVTDGLASQNQMSYTYNANGTTATATDARGKLTTYTYFSNGNLMKITPASPLGTTQFTYDSLGRVQTLTDGLGHVTTYTYDVMDRPTQTVYQGGLTISETYDPDGHLLTQTDSSGTTTFVFNALGQPTRQTLPGGIQTDYTWDGEGNPLSVTDAGGTTTYGYNPLDLVSSITEPGGAQTTITYTANGQESTRLYPNGDSILCSYDASGRLTQIQNKRGSTLLLGFTYSYANPTSGSDTDLWQTMTSGGVVTTYSYDALNRLLEASAPGSDYRYTYDGAGNRLTQNANGTVTNYTYNNANEMTAAGSTTYTYDANGSETGSSAALALVYNNATQTTSVTPPGGSATAMSYLGAGQATRTSAGSTSYTSNLLGLASETTSGQTTRYARDDSGTLIDERTNGGGGFYYLYDGLGSVVGLTNSSGTLVNTYTYDPYGNTISSTGTTPNRWKFAGGYQDPSGLYKFGERYYDPTTGRWLQLDPVAGSGDDPTSLAGYAYAGDDPINLTDPFGLKKKGGGGNGHWHPHWHPPWTPQWQPEWTPVWTPHPVLASGHHVDWSAGGHSTSFWRQVAHFLYTGYKAGKDAWDAAGSLKQDAWGWIKTCWDMECWNAIPPP